MADIVEYVILAAIFVETTVWMWVLVRTGRIQAAIAPIVDRLLPVLSMLPIPSPGAPTGPIEVLHTKRGQPYYRDPVTGVTRFLPKGTTSVPSSSASVPASVASPVAPPVPLTVSPDILETPQAKAYIAQLAAQTGLPEEQVRSMAADFLKGGTLPGAAGASPSPGMPPVGGAQVNPVASIIQAVISGQLPFKDALAAGVPLFLQGSKFAPGGDRSTATTSGSGYW